MAKRKKTKSIKRSLTPYEAMDQADESQIINDIEGRIPSDPEVLVYTFPDKQTGKEITGLSWRGTKEVWREFNKRKITELTITDKIVVKQGPDYIDVGVYAQDKKRKIGAWGMARAYAKMRLKTGELVEDRFASAKAMSKAQRNALNQLFPAEKVALMIKRWIEKGKAKNLVPNSQEKNKTSRLFASEADKNRILEVAKEMHGQGRIDQFIEKTTGLKVDWKNMTKTQATNILALLLEKRIKK